MRRAGEMMTFESCWSAGHKGVCPARVYQDQDLITKLMDKIRACDSSRGACDVGCPSLVKS